jgi:formylglycine-generating enzyme required for sulfatase activity
LRDDLLQESDYAHLRHRVDILTRGRGVIVKTSLGNYDFIHPVFEDYLVARHLAQDIRNNKLEQIVTFLEAQMAADETTQFVWCERILLMIGYLSIFASSHAKLFLHRLARVENVSGEDNTEPDVETRHRIVEIALIGAQEWPKLTNTLAKLELSEWLLTCPQVTPKLRVKAGKTIAKIGDPRTQIIEVEAVEFCYVPPGSFRMGDQREAHENHHLNYGYWLSRFPITVAQFARFLELTDHVRDEKNSLGEYANHPVVHINWHDAQAFCHWLTAHYHAMQLLPPTWQVALPSEAEWEKGARGGLQIPHSPLIARIGSIETLQPALNVTDNDMPYRVYPWGDEESTDRSNYAATDIRHSSAVGSFPTGRSPYGCEEMCGNVSEWTRSIYKTYPYNPTDGRENIFNKRGWRIFRGGAFKDNQYFIRCSTREKENPMRGEKYRGFRVMLLPI